jgi:hypothetical protein
MVLAGLREVHGRTPKILFKHQHVIAGFIRDLDMEHVQFRSTLEKILSGVVDEIELAQLLRDQRHHRWKDKELEKIIKQRIGPDAYDTYFTTISRVARLLTELGDAVGMQGKVSVSIAKNLKSL